MGRLCCAAILTSFGLHQSRALPLANTWGKEVDRLVFATDKKIADPRFFDAKCGHNYWSCPRKQAWLIRHLMATVDPYAWYVFGDDDTYFIVPNLKSYIVNRYS